MDFWKTGKRSLALSRPLLMGILNVTPDSFSDGGRHDGADAAALAAMEMVSAGADIIDIGGESTRPGASYVDEKTEMERVLPAIRRIRPLSDVPISVDTRRASVADAALEAGADIINDVSSLEDGDMAAAVKRHGAGIVLMHGYREHVSLCENPPIGELGQSVCGYLAERARHAISLGIDPASIAIDPGLGFGKTTEENIAVMRAMPLLAKMPYPVLIGLSRKRFIGEITKEKDPLERDPGSISAMLWTIWHGASILRMHDVRGARSAIDIASALA